MNKHLYFDVETTGKSPYKNDIIQFAAIIEIDGQVRSEFEVKMKPIDPNNIDEEALKVNGITREQLNSDEYMLPRTGYSTICKHFEEFVDKFDRSDKFVPCGFNVDFDLSFVEQFFRKNGDNYFGSWVDRRLSKDPFPVLRYLRTMGVSALKDAPSMKLSELTQFFKINHGQAHTAMSDVRATRDLIKLLDRGLNFSLPNLQVDVAALDAAINTLEE